MRNARNDNHRANMTAQQSPNNPPQSDDPPDSRMARMADSEVAQRSRRIVLDSVIALDAAMIVVLSAGAHFVYETYVLGSVAHWQLYGGVGMLGALLATIFFKSAGLYKFEVLLADRGKPGQTLACWTGVVLTLLAMAFVTKTSDHFSRGWLLIWLTSTALYLAVARAATARLLDYWMARGRLMRHVAIVGAGQLGRRLIRRLQREPNGVRIVGLFDDRKTRVCAVGDQRLNGTVDDLIRLARSKRIDEIIVALPAAAEDRILQVLDRLAVLPADIRLSPDMIGFRLSKSSYSRIGSLLFLNAYSRPIKDWDSILKRIEDATLSTLMLIALLPAMLLIALAIKLESPGPALFRQRRHGFNEDVITVLKFRTMRVQEDGATVRQATRDDDRITRVGRFLRRTSLDELPQLINVLRGEMSVVGPRPHALAHNDEYSRIIDRYLTRHRVKPGITGWAQVNGLRGETDTPNKMRKRVEYDLDYIENWSLWFDLQILLMTPFRGLVHANAY